MNGRIRFARAVLGHRWFRRTVVILLFVSSAAIACAWYTGIWSRRDYFVYRQMERECHPVWRDLYWGRIRPGDDVESVIRQTSPAGVERYANFTILRYQKDPERNVLHFTGVDVTAKDGRIICAGAGSCCWDWTFFDATTTHDRDGLHQAMTAHWKPIWEQNERERIAEQVAAANLPIE